MIDHTFALFAYILNNSYTLLALIKDIYFRDIIIREYVENRKSDSGFILFLFFFYFIDISYIAFIISSIKMLSSNDYHSDLSDKKIFEYLLLVPLQISVSLMNLCCEFFYSCGPFCGCLFAIIFFFVILGFCIGIFILFIPLYYPSLFIFYIIWAIYILKTNKGDCSKICCDCDCKCNCDCCEKVRDKGEDPSIIFFQFRFTYIQRTEYLILRE